MALVALDNKLKGETMNKRDKFAMAAMQAIIGKSPFNSDCYTDEEHVRDSALSIARGAYFYADAMLEVREEAGAYGDSVQLLSHFDGSNLPTDFLEQREHPCKGGCEACVGCNVKDDNI